MDEQAKYMQDFMESQKQLLDSWTDSSQKMQEAFWGQDALQNPGTDLVREWQQKQQAVMEGIASAKDPQEALQHAPENFRKWMEVQTDFANRWMDLYKQHAAKYDLNDAAQDQMARFTEMWKDAYGKWEAQMVAGTRRMQDVLAPRMSTNMVPNLLNFTKSYTTLFEYWEPIMRTMQYGPQAGDFTQMLRPDAYRQLVDTMMGYSSTEQMRQASEQAQRLFTQYARQIGQMNDQGKQMMQPIMENMQQFATGDWASLVNMTMDVYGKMQQAYAPFTHIAAPGKEKEMMTLLQEAQQNYSEYMVKASEMQMMVYQGAQKAMNDTVEEYANGFQKEGKLPSYDEFFTRWIDVVEKHIVGVFQSKEYGKLQGEVASRGLTVKASFDGLIEKMTTDLPFTMRSEADALAEEVHSLKRKVRELEKKNATDEKKPASKPASKPAAKTASSRASASKSTAAKKKPAASASKAEPKAAAPSSEADKK